MSGKESESRLGPISVHFVLGGQHIPNNLYRACSPHLCRLTLKAPAVLLCPHRASRSSLIKLWEALFRGLLIPLMREEPSWPDHLLRAHLSTHWRGHIQTHRNQTVKDFDLQSWTFRQWKPTI